METTQNPQISSDPGVKGFDLSAGKTWIYPENYPVRDYQFNIVQAALYKNTLVCLPTGLGKTFIAAVLMYNFWLWYPCGKIVFLAPTKPLVTQQINACHNIMGIPNTETIELTGMIGQKQRQIAWLKKRVVFATPQVFHNDLEKNIIPADLIKCVVIDEAHKALGKHSYCECIRILKEKNQYFRILALSATPGNKIDNVHEVLQNLLIAHVELRDETSLDITPYINKRKVDIILVPLSNELAQYKERYIFIMDRHVKVLLQHNVLRGSTSNISKGRIFHLLNEFQSKTNKPGNYGQIIKTLNILMTMYHAYELMIRDGLRAFHKFYENHSDKFWMNEETQLQKLLGEIKEYLGPFPDVETIRKNSTVDILGDIIFGHTKFEKLKELLLHHFTCSQENQTDTRAIVFVEYRDIVNEVYVLLLQCQPLIKPQIFVGQAGQKQKQQLKALENFRNNHVNVLISTSIGEEGLDVGEVDLIICFDVSQRSPTRLVQRMGRTGRKRDGHIIILVTDGKEHETLKSAMARRDSLNSKILNTSNIFSSLYQNNPRMIPDSFKPKCLKMHISIEPKTLVTKNKNKKPDKKNSKRKDMLKSTITDSDRKLKKDGSKFSMTKFFKIKPEDNVKSNTCLPGSGIIQNNNNAIKQSDIKILSCDNEAIDFLTMCTLRNSKMETATKEKCSNNKLYVPEFSRIKDFFNFSVPDIKILDCLIMLEDVPLDHSNSNFQKDEKKNEYKNDNLYNDERVFIEESKFEDLLNDSSSKSNESSTSSNKKDRNNESSSCAFTTAFKEYSNSNISKIMETENQTNTLQDLEPGIFEDVLDELSDSSEGNFHIQNIQTKQSLSDIKLNGNTGQDNVNLQEMIIANNDFTSVSQNNHNFENCERILKHNRTSKFNQFKDESLFTITQAVQEIARFNSNSSTSKAVNESEDDMFQEESFLTQIDNDIDLINNVNYLFKNNESNDKIILDKSKNLDNGKNINNVKVKLEEYQWDDDFEVSIEPIYYSTKFSFPKEKDKKLIVNKTNVEKQIRLDSEELISAEKSPSILTKNIARLSIPKTLETIKKNRNSRSTCANQFLSDECTYQNNTFSTKRKVEKEMSYFVNDSTDDSDYDVSYEQKHEDQKTEYLQKHSSGNRKRRKINEFIDNEAEVSSNNYSSDESSGTDTDLDGFISYTQNLHDTTNMHVHYLNTVRSPINPHQGFVFKEPRMLDTNVEIYSQPNTQIDESYINDSFCVKDDEDELQEATRMEELCELEKAEQKLEKLKRKRKQKQKRKRKCKTGETLDCNARRRINKRKKILSSCRDSSSDSCGNEIKKLRKQIIDE